MLLGPAEQATYSVAACVIAHVVALHHTNQICPSYLLPYLVSVYYEFARGACLLIGMVPTTAEFPAVLGIHVRHAVSILHPTQMKPC